MKKLQNNFTTPEQSKRLLELGVPNKSADCYYDKYSEAYDRYNICEDGYFDEHYQSFEQLIPCWSVGRLREIFCICSSVNGTREYPFCNDQIAWWITEFEFKKEFINFSKLEDYA